MSYQRGTGRGNRGGGTGQSRGSNRGSYGSGNRGGSSFGLQNLNLHEGLVYKPPDNIPVPTIDSKLLWRSKSKTGSFDQPFANFEERKKNVGKAGTQVMLYTNHFNLHVEKLETIFQYDVVFTIEGRNREIARKDYDLLYRAFEEMKNNYRKEFGNSLVKSVLDAPKNIYSAIGLNLKSNNEFQVTLPEVSDIPDVLATVKAVIKLTTMIQVSEGIKNFLTDKVGKVNQPIEVTSVFNIVLGYSARIMKGFDNIGRSIFSPERGTTELPNGKSIWFGLYQSTRMEWQLRINIDMVCKPAYSEGSVLAFAAEFLECPQDNVANNLKTDSLLRGLSKELFGLKVRFIRPDNNIRDSKVVKIIPGDSKNTFFDNVDGASGQSRKVSVFDFFKETYGFTLKKPELPVVHVGNKNKTVYWPMECLILKSQACPVSKGLVGKQAEQIIRIAAKRPDDRKAVIETRLKALNNCFKDDAFAKAFGLGLDGQMLTVKGRILAPPKLSYLDKAKALETTPVTGKWKASAGFNTSKKLSYWGVLDLVGLSEQDVLSFCLRLKNDGEKCGMTFSKPTLLKGGRHEMDKKFAELYSLIKPPVTDKDANPKPDLIMVLVQDKDNTLYANIKHLGEIVCGIPTQVVLRKNVQKPDTMLAHNICLKINAKLGGTNQKIAQACTPKVLMRPVMFIGADVTHSSPQDMKPSIAAVVGSMDQKASIYHCLVSVQERQSAKSEERILKMEEMVKKLLYKFHDSNNGRKPEKIIYYRDGVSEGQFEEVMNCEISAIQRACKSVQADGYEPGITFVVVQKRHHTRFFPVNAGKDMKSGNVPPGTVVDQDIVHPRQQSFYLASHEGIQGTTKPAHYHLLFDDNNFNADDLQQLTYYLCHLYSRCERSVSYPAPTYYAHLSAFRARHHHNVLIEKHLAHDRSEIEKLEDLQIPNYFL